MTKVLSLAGAVLALCVLVQVPAHAANDCVSSWYGGFHHGRLMANGERFNKEAPTVAHRTLPLNSHILIRDPITGRTLQARVTDRGPYIAGRCLDVSEGIAKTFGFRDRGLLRLQIEPMKGPRRT